MLVVIIINVILALLVSYFCLRELKFDFSLWTMGINFVVCAGVVGLSEIAVYAHADDIRFLTFLAIIMLILGVLLLFLAIIMNIPRQFKKPNWHNLGVMLIATGIIILVVLWRKPFDCLEFLVPEIATIFGFYLLIKDRI